MHYKMIKGEEVLMMSNFNQDEDDVPIDGGDVNALVKLALAEATLDERQNEQDMIDRAHYSLLKMMTPEMAQDLVLTQSRSMLARRNGTRKDCGQKFLLRAATEPTFDFLLGIKNDHILPVNNSECMPLYIATKADIEEWGRLRGRAIKSGQEYLSDAGQELAATLDKILPELVGGKQIRDVPIY